MELEKATEDQRSAHRQKDDSYKQSLTLSMNRIEEIKTEFQSLEDTLSSATIFFSCELLPFKMKHLNHVL